LARLWHANGIGPRLISVLEIAFPILGSGGLLFREAVAKRQQCQLFWKLSHRFNNWFAAIF
jgi:hypothetical protein